MARSSLTSTDPKGLEWSDTNISLASLLYGQATLSGKSGTEEGNKGPITTVASAGCGPATTQGLGRKSL